MFYNGQEACLPFALKGDTIFISHASKQTCSFLWRETQYLSSKIVCFTNTFLKILQKVVFTSLLATCAEMQHMENCLTTFQPFRNGFPNEKKNKFFPRKAVLVVTKGCMCHVSHHRLVGTKGCVLYSIDASYTSLP